MPELRPGQPVLCAIGTVPAILRGTLGRVVGRLPELDHIHNQPAYMVDFGGTHIAMFRNELEVT